MIKGRSKKMHEQRKKRTLRGRIEQIEKERSRDDGKRANSWNRSNQRNFLLVGNISRKENGLKQIGRGIGDSHFPSKYRQLCQQTGALTLVKCLRTFMQPGNKRRTGCRCIGDNATEGYCGKNRPGTREPIKRLCGSFALESDRFALFR